MQSNPVRIKEQKQNIYSGIKELRERINSHFDKLEQEIVKELNAAKLDLNIKIEDLFKELREKSERIAVLQNNISYVKNYASDLQTLVGSKKIETKIQCEETYIQSLMTDERLKQLSLKYSHNEEKETLFQSITSFGLMSKESSPPSVEIKLEKNEQAQTLTASFIPKSVDNVCAKLVRKFQIPQVKSNENEITGCAMFPNGKIIFADGEKKKHATFNCFSFKGEKIWEFTDEIVLYGPRGVAVERNGIVYVATGNRNCIVAISPDVKKVADFLTSDDGIEKPFKLFCDSNRDLLLVVECDGDCALFEIK
ncbi:TRIM2_3 [Mytilus coruscus]|uniref:TRIM2_3 n=1 Tax=Mytilus coruscus TaxID=42192 RepID=A0A6J8CY49_MYTCO|nr:TRIM2_3 [Mytilus coruscus]